MDRQDDDSEAGFGARFLEEWKRLGGPLAGWSYAEIQELRGCDQEGMARALRRNQPRADYAAIQRVRGAPSPEHLARTLLAEAQTQAQASAAATMWLLIGALLMG
jgi:hypothetical protein